MIHERVVRETVIRMLEWSDAHVAFPDAVQAVPVAARGVRVESFPHSLWELLEHIRITQSDILEFSTNPGYVEMEWPRDYWPSSPVPPNDDAWDDSVGQVLANRASLQSLARTETLDLTSQIPHGTGQTYLRELLLVADHTAYHVGQIIAVRRQLGTWPAA